MFVRSWRKGINGNSIGLAETLTNGTVSGANLAGGVKGGEAQQAIGRYGLAGLPVAADTVVIGADVAASLANLLASIIANDAANVVASVSGGILSLYLITSGVAGNTYVLTETGTNSYVTGAGTFVDGLDAVPFDRSTLSWIRMRVRDL